MEPGHGNVLQAVGATVVAICGGCAIVFLFFAAMGAVPIGDAIVATIVALVMGLIWFVAFYTRQRTIGSAAQWRDRERRGF